MIMKRWLSFALVIFATANFGAVHAQDRVSANSEPPLHIDIPTAGR
jgi:hypothetical protein